MAHAITWFEIPALDFERAKKFYTHVLQFEMHDEMMGVHRMGYLPGNAMQGDVTGALVHGEGCTPGASGVTLYLDGGNDLAPLLARVVEAGGKVLVPKTHISDEIGYFAQFLDTEGNRLAFHSRG
jgi:predicted enzyme related to lactoylglutathione lyase